jgi:hypothetical protein
METLERCTGCRLPLPKGPTGETAVPQQQRETGLDILDEGEDSRGGDWLSSLIWPRTGTRVTMALRLYCPKPQVCSLECGLADDRSRNESAGGDSNGRAADNYVRRKEP